MLRTIALLTALLSACGGGGSMPGDDGDDMPAVTPDAPKPMNPNPPPPQPLKPYGQSCGNASECQSGLCVGTTASNQKCSRSCNLDVALDCKDVDAFCVPLQGGGGACFGTIESGNDNDDAIVEIGDSVTRLLTPLGDTDVFQVRLNTLGNTTITATPEAGIDVKIDAYGQVGEPLAIANAGGAGVAEALQTNVQQIGTHVFVAVTNVGQSTGGFTLSVAHVAATSQGGENLPSAVPLLLQSAE